MNKEKFIEFYAANEAGINGALIGLIISILILLLGPFRFLFITLCCGVGYFIGLKLSKDKEYLKMLLERILPPGSYR